MHHLRATIWLLVLTGLLVCGLYPLALWLVGQALFRDQADGSLLVENGTVRGSRLLAQPFTQAKYFKPRPSAVGYNAAGSGGSNLAASNPLLRDRVARQIGPMARFANGQGAGDRVGPVVQAWFLSQPGYLATWAKDNPSLAQRWVKDDDNRAAVLAWMGVEIVPADRSDADTVLENLAVEFFTRFAGRHPRHWPVPDKDKLDARQVVAVAKDEDNISDLQGVMFDPWLTAHPDQASNIEKVPADLVLASGSGLDPHITRRGADYQLPDVVAAWAKETGLGEREVRRRIRTILDRHEFRPLGFLGEPLVNVVEVNRALDAEMK
jgi:K+-transporting ATPase ATPase C chain